MQPRDEAAGATTPLDEGTSADASWIELSVEADPEAVEAVSEILARVSVGGVAIQPGFESLQEGLAARIDVTRPARVSGYIPAGNASVARSATEQVRTQLGHLQAFGLRPIADLQTSVVAESDWSDAWRANFPLQRLGRRLVLRPSWRAYEPADTEIVIALDPGMAFGTGLHPTTRLCLVALERAADRGWLARRRVLDLGSGSGILAIAAAHLGAQRVVALDTDPLAVEATRSNAELNGLRGKIDAHRGSLPARDAPFDVIVANLVASLLVELASPLYGALEGGNGTVGSGGRLLCSGVIAEREPEVRRALAAAGLHVLGRDADGDWILLEAERID